MKGNIGEALVQYLLSHFCLVHKIDGSNDVGNDFICELIKQQYPTNLLFYVQVKFTKSKPTISKTTLEYWKSSPIPVYLFWIKGDPPPSFTNPPDFNFFVKKYKRMTPFLHRPDKHSKEKFKTFSEQEFKRDLIIDYARTQYIKGFIPIVEPRDFLELDEKIVLGFPQYQILIKDVIPEYSYKILNRSWVQIMVMAILLGENATTKNMLEVAINLLNTATILLNVSDDEAKYSYSDLLERYTRTFLEKIDQLDF